MDDIVAQKGLYIISSVGKLPDQFEKVKAELQANEKRLVTAIGLQQGHRAPEFLYIK